MDDVSDDLVAKREKATEEYNIRTDIHNNTV